MNYDPINYAELRRGGAPLWVSGINYSVGDVRLSQVDFRAYVRITAGGGVLDPAVDPTNWRSPSWGIKSIQRGVSRTPAGLSTTPFIVTISAVNPKKTFVNLLSNCSGDSSYMGIELISETQLRLTCWSYTGGYNAQSLSWEVVEWF